MTPGLILDMDETLYPERQFIRSGFNAVASEVHARYGVPERDARATLMMALRRGSRSRALQLLCLEYDLPPAIVPDLVDVIRSHEPALRLPAASVDLLVRARAQGWRVGVLTNGTPDVQARKALALGLDAHVDTIVYAAEWGSGRGKPERDAFDVVRDRLGTAPADSVVVGDDPWCDIFGGRNAGLHTILLTRHPERVRATGAERVVADPDAILIAAADLVRREVAHAA